MVIGHYMIMDYVELYLYFTTSNLVDKKVEVIPKSTMNIDVPQLKVNY